MGVNRNLLYILSLVLLASCFKDSYDFENFSDRIEYSPSIAAPIAHGNLSIENLYEFNDSSDLDTIGSTIIYSYRKDSLFSFDVSDFGNIPEQRAIDFIIKSSGEIPPLLMPDQVNLVKSDTFSFSFDNGMRLDSFLLEEGVLSVDVQSSFKHTGVLRISSNNIVDQWGDTFTQLIQISSSSGDYSSSQNYPLNDSKLTLKNSGDDNYIIFNFDLILFKSAGQGIENGDEVIVDFTFKNLNEYSGIFGFMGTHEEVFDTIIESPLEDFENLKGTFAVTNPRLSLDYSNSLGVPFGLNMDILATFDDGTEVNINQDELDFNSSTNYLDPEVFGEIVLSREQLPNIDSLLVFPPAKTFDIYVAALSNEQGDIGIPNFILKNSKLNVDLVIEIPLEFRADLVLTDTLDIALGDINVDEVEYANLYYTIENQFPITFDISLLAFDSQTNQIIDTVDLSSPGKPGLIIAAPVDENGITIVDQVQPYTGYVTLSSNQAKNLLNESDKIIMQASISTTEGANSVKILKDYTFNFNLSLEAAATIITGGE